MGGDEGRRSRLICGLAAGGAALLLGTPSVGSEVDALDARALALHRDAIVIDGHNDVALWLLHFDFDLGMDGWEPADRWAWFHYELPWLPRRPDAQELRTHTDLARIASGGLDAQFFSVWANPDHYDVAEPAGFAFARANEIIDAYDAQLARHPDRLERALTAGDVRRIAAQGKLAFLLGVEGGHMIEDDLANLRALHARGARYMTLTWSFSLDWAGSSGDAGRDHGLSDFGRDVVREMNALGMLIDVSHVSDPTFWDVMEATRAPVIASHSSVRALVDHPRNMSDEMLEAIAANGGVVMINFFTMFLDARKVSPGALSWDWLSTFGGSETTVAHVVDHIEHVARVAGIDHVGLGSDFDGGPFMPTDLRHVGDLPNLTAELLRRGHSDAEIRKVLGENVLRVLAEAERQATPQPGRTSPPS